VYVSEYRSHRVQKLASDGRLLASWGADWPSPFMVDAVAVAPDGTLYLGDSSLRQVFHTTARGEVLDAWPLLGSDGTRLRQPEALVLASDGRAYLFNSAGWLDQRSIGMVTPHGRGASPWPVSVNDHTADLDQATLSPTGNVLVPAGRRQVLVFSPEGARLAPWVLPAPLIPTTGWPLVAEDGAGQRYLLDSNDHTWSVRKLAADGTELARWATSSPVGARVPPPGRLTVAPNGDLLIGAGEGLLRLGPDLQPVARFQVAVPPGTTFGVARVPLSPTEAVYLVPTHTVAWAAP
jgi:hypothetical protein